MKKLLFTLLSVMFVLSASAETITGNAGSNINWSYDTEDCILTFTGSGAMPNYESPSDTPWDNIIVNPTDKIKNQRSVLEDVEILVIGNGITSIGDNNFCSAKYLESVTLPTSVTRIGLNAFYNCPYFATLNWNSIADNINIDATAFTGTGIIQNGLLYIGNVLVKVYSTYEGTSLTINNGINKINAKALEGNTKIISLSIPNSVTQIGEDAFKNTKLSSVTFNANIKTFGTWFKGLTTLKSINIPSSVTAISSDAFNGCTALSNITFANANNITSWGSNIFNGCPATTNGDFKIVGGCVITDVTDLTKKKYTLPAGIVYIAENAFAGCNNAQYLDLSDYTKAPTFASGALADVTTATTLVAAGYEKNFTAKGWKNVNTTKFSIYNNKFVSRTFLHDAITPTGVAVYRAEVTGSKVKLIKINADNAPCKVAAGEGVFLRASTNKEYTFSPAGQSVAMMSNNAIKGVTEDMTFDGSENAYILATVDGIQDFYRIADTYTLSMGKAYLDGGSSDLSKLNAFEEETSGIDQVETQQSNAKTTIYNMNGQRLSAPQEGINIINGKKYIVK